MEERTSPKCQLRAELWGSGSQAQAVIENSQEADIVHLALALDINKIQQAGLIKPGWEKKLPKMEL
ncbi:hypothetical protein [Leptolyngbya sp. FACHB-261]|uniref:hypothetical protein n=1 Tax=Leptolyngbya sp. FACHB-261 TaxID=2692806 RepID=UPI001F5589D6|nr:hypothetical protein [Leptolyngbya sp. FACHB-261]